MSMTLRVFLTMILSLFLSENAFSTTQTQYQSGFREVTIKDKERPLQIAIWYPTNQQQPIEKIGENMIFDGENCKYPLK